MDKTPFLLPVIALGIFGTIFAIARVLRERRKQALLDSGSEMGFAPAEEESLSIHGIPLFDQRNGTFRTIMQGAAGGYEAWLFDYEFMRGKARIVQTVVAFKNSGMNLPPFQLHPKGFLDSIAAALSSKIVKFPMTNPFADRFTVVSADPEAVVRLFTPELQNYLEGLPQTGWTIEGCDDALALYRRQKKVPASGLRGFVDEAGSVAQGFLAFVSKKGLGFGR